MIISHRHRFIFIHCRKVAGSSMAAYLAQFLGPNDLMVDSWNDAIGAGASYNRRFYKDMLHPRAAAEAVRRAVSDLKRGRKPTRRGLHRAYFSLYDRRLGERAKFASAAGLSRWAPEEWASYFKFCFVRNPYAKAVSDYNWRVTARGAGHVSFTEFLRRLDDPDRPDPERLISSPKDNWTLYTIDDRVAVDYVGRLEQLPTDMASVCERIGLPFEEKRFPHTKKGDGRDYRSYYREGDAERVYQVFRKEIDQFGYTF